MQRWKPILLMIILALTACRLPSMVDSLQRDDQSSKPTPTASPILATITPTDIPTVTSQPPTATPTLTSTPRSYTPLFQPADCPMAVEPGYRVDCGYLMVPEDRGIPAGRSVRLAVAVYHAWGSDPAPDPVVHLSGGPGGSSLSISRYMLRTGFDRVLEERDVIFFDQRGTGFSVPRLDCPEREQASPVLLASHQTITETLPLVVDAFSRCRDRLRAEGVDLSQYNSAASAADIADLRIALGYAEIDLFGASYGTRLALTILRDRPEGIRAVVLDSVYPLEGNLYTDLPANAQRAFDVFFNRCAADLYCSGQYPDLEDRFYTLVDSLDSQPASLDYRGNSITLTGKLLVDVLFTGLYNPLVTADMPQMIAEIEIGEYALLRERIALYFEPGTALGMQMSVQCREEIPFGSVDDLHASSMAARPQVASTFENSTLPLLEACAIWGVPAADPVENQPVNSDVPALILAGEGDPVTPPAWAQETANQLSSSYYYSFAGMGHWVARSNSCAIDLIIEFLRTPTVRPSTSCH